LGAEEERLVLNLRSSRGFTIVELMVGVTIVAIILAAAAPSFGGMLQNSKLGNAAASYMTGLQLARAEAIRRNQAVEFILTANPVTTGVENSATPSVNGANWVVRVMPAGETTYALVEAKPAIEGSGGTASPISIVGATASDAPTGSSFDGSVVFNGFGGIANGIPLDFEITIPGKCAPNDGPIRCQRIRARPGGQLQLCDPIAEAGDSRACR
jgi:type IV fimbrial biogenesis protein FimT